jgi:hypothetical protein
MSRGTGHGPPVGPSATFGPHAEAVNKLGQALSTADFPGFSPFPLGASAIFSQPRGGIRQDGVRTFHSPDKFLYRLSRENLPQVRLEAPA